MRCTQIRYHSSNWRGFNQQLSPLKKVVPLSICLRNCPKKPCLLSGFGTAQAQTTGHSHDIPAIFGSRFRWDFRLMQVDAGDIISIHSNDMVSYCTGLQNSIKNTKLQYSTFKSKTGNSPTYVNSVVQYISKWNHHQKRGEKKTSCFSYWNMSIPQINQPRHWRQATPSIPNSFLGFSSSEMKDSFLATDEHQNRIHCLNAVRFFLGEKYGWKIWSLIIFITNGLDDECECANGQLP